MVSDPTPTADEVDAGHGNRGRGLLNALGLGGRRFPWMMARSETVTTRMAANGSRWICADDAS